MSLSESTKEKSENNKASGNKTSNNKTVKNNNSGNKKVDENSIRERKTRRKIMHQQGSINGILILLGIVIVVQFIMYLQKEYSAKKQDRSAALMLDTICEALDQNTAEIDLLMDRYHSNNQAILNDIVDLLQSDTASKLIKINDREARSKAMRELANAIGENGFLFVIDDEGKIVDSQEMEYVGKDLLEDGTLDQEKLQDLLDGKQVTTNLEGDKAEVYLYVRKVRKGFYALYGVESKAQKEHVAAIRDLTPTLSSLVVGENGFTFAVATRTGKFRYYNHGGKNLEGESCADYGVSKEMLVSGYKGIQTIDGSRYYCVTRRYSSSFYGRDLILAIANGEEETFGSDWTTIVLTILFFVLGAVLCVVYAGFLRYDPEQIVGYDEHVMDRRLIKQEHKKGKKLLSLKNVQLFRIKGDPVYFKLGIARKLFPVVVVSIIIVFASSWNSQTLTALTHAFAQSTAAMEQLSKQINNRQSTQQLLVDYYEQQYLSKAKLISYIFNEDPERLFESGAFVEGVDAYHYYVDEEYNKIKNENGTLVRSIQNSSILQSICDINNIDAIYIYDDHGRTIATNTDNWNFSLSSDPDAQSYPFTDVIRGIKDSVSQTAGVDEYGDVMQYFGVVFNYYTLEGTGPDKGKFVPESALNEYYANDIYYYKDYSYAVKAHRSLIQLGINDERIAEITKSVSTEHLLNQTKTGNDGFVIVLDNSEEHICLWSPNEVNIGKTAEELNITARAFSGSFKGFNRIDGVRYLQDFKFADGYWIGSSMPTKTLFAGREAVSWITVLVCMIFYLIMALVCTMTTGSVEEEIEKNLEHRLSKQEDNGMAQVVMPSGKIKYVRSAVARFDTTKTPWANAGTDQRMGIVIRYVIAVITVILLSVCGIVESRTKSESALRYIIGGQWERGFNYFAVVGVFLMILSVAVISFIGRWIIGLVVFNMGTRIETVGRLMLSVIKYGSVLFSLFYGLSLLGFSTSGLVTSASILSLIVGLGSQKLIGDIVAGIFIVFEGEFRVGDIVTISDYRGRVVDIGLRTTKIEAVGDIKIFNNSSISGVLNMTKKASRTPCKIAISYEESLERVEKVIQENLPKIRKKIPAIIDGPYYLGVDSLLDSGVLLSFYAQCAEDDRMAVARDLNRQLLLMFQKNGIEIPYPQLVVTKKEDTRKETIADDVIED